MSERTLIKDAIVLSIDPDIGELPRASILVEDGKIAAVGPNVTADGAKVIDATGDIVIPGFIDTHRHTWETSIRTSAPDFALITYFGSILDKFAPHYRPDDVLAANRWGALESLNAGITTLVDWSHIMNTPDHADAAIHGLQDTGIRSVFAYGFGNTSLVDWWFGPGLHGQRPDLRRRRRPPPAQAVLQLRRPARHDGPGDSRHRVLQARRGPPRLGARQGARPQHHRPRRHGPVRLHQAPGPRAARHGPALPEHHVRPCLALHRRGVGAGPRLRRQRVVRAADRGPDGPRLGAGGHGAQVRRADRAVVRRRHDRPVRPVHPDALDPRVRARSQAPGGVGREPGRSRGVARAHHLAAGPRMGDARRREGRRPRRPDRLDHARQAGRPRDHRHVRGERVTGHRPRRRGRLRRGRLERPDRPRRRRTWSRTTSD